MRPLPSAPSARPGRPGRPARPNRPAHHARRSTAVLGAVGALLCAAGLAAAHAPAARAQQAPGGAPAAAPASSPALSLDEMMQLLRTIDERQQNVGDYRSVAYLEQKERGKQDLASEVVVFRRDSDDKLMILFTKPKTEAGKGYLRLDKNLFFYDPTVGKWERRTERERIGGTDSRRQDFDGSKIAAEYTPSYVGLEKLGKLSVHHLLLAARPGVDVAFPSVNLFIDVASGNVLKREDRALSGKLLRTTYYPRWNKIHSPIKRADVYFPAEIRIYDEVEKGNQTTMVIRETDLSPLDANLFTKAWLESKSR